MKARKPKKRVKKKLAAAIAAKPKPTCRYNVTFWVDVEEAEHADGDAIEDIVTDMSDAWLQSTSTDAGIEILDSGGFTATLER